MNPTHTHTHKVQQLPPLLGASPALPFLTSPPLPAILLHSPPLLLSPLADRPLQHTHTHTLPPSPLLFPLRLAPPILRCRINNSSAMAPSTTPFFGVSHHAFISRFHRSCVLHNRHIFVLSPGISSESNFSWGVGSSVGSSYGRSTSSRPGRGQQGWQEQRRPPSTTAAQCSASSRGSS